jgi:hypothetical protein
MPSTPHCKFQLLRINGSCRKLWCEKKLASETIYIIQYNRVYNKNVLHQIALEFR